MMGKVSGRMMGIFQDIKPISRPLYGPIKKLTAQINRKLAESYSISHTTLQYECRDCGAAGIDANSRKDSQC